MSGSTARALALVAAAVGLVLQPVSAGTYLTGGNAPACWKSSFGASSASEIACDGIVELKYVEAPPASWSGDTSPTIKYEFTVLNGDVVPTAVTGLQGELYHIVHTNLHSCYSNAGACTPFVKNTPGLSTHTPEKQVNLTGSGTGMYGSVSTTGFGLEPGRYNVIAHVRWYGADGSKYDAAMGSYSVVDVAKNDGAPPTSTATDTSTRVVAVVVVVVVVLILIVAVMLLVKSSGTAEVEGNYAHRREKMNGARDEEEGKVVAKAHRRATFDVFFLTLADDNSMKKKSHTASRMIISTSADYATFLKKVQLCVG